MPTFDFTSPEGKTYSVDGPEGATKEQAFQILQSHLGNSQDGGGSSLGGVAKSLGVGLAQGALDIAGLPATLAHMYAPNPSDPNPLGPEGLQKKVEQYTGDFYKPQGVLEETANKIGQFAPNVIGGPESLGARVLTRAVAPAVGAEIGEKATEGTPYQALGTIGGAVLGGVTGPKIADAVASARAGRSAAAALPTGDDLVKQGSQQFQTARNMDIAVKPDFAKSTAADMRAALKDYDPEDSGVKDVFRKINRIDDLASVPAGSAPRYNALIPPPPVAMNDIENVRKQLSELRMSPDPTTRAAAKTALQKLTDSQQALSPADVVSGDADAYANTMRQAVGNYAAGKRSLVVQGKQDLADLNAGTAGSGANIDNNTRQAFKQLVRPMNNTNVPVAKKLGFNDQEIDAIKSAATGTAVGNTARYLGKFAPTGIVSAAGAAGAGHIIGGPIGTVAVPAVGYIAKKIGDLSTAKAVKALDSLVRSRSPLAQQVAAQISPTIVNKLPPKTLAMLGIKAGANGAKVTSAQDLESLREAFLPGALASAQPKTR